jgi:hypothetical protein
MATKRRKRSRRFTRKQLISALGLDKESRKPNDRYAATTSEFLHKVKYSGSRASVKARKKLGI